MRCDVTDVVTPEIVREAFRKGGIKVGAGVGVQDGDGDGDESALSEASGRRVLVTENRSSQPLATLSCTHTAGFGERDRLSRHAVAAVAVRSTPIVQGRHVPPTLTLTLIMRNYVLSPGTHEHAYREILSNVFV